MPKNTSAGLVALALATLVVVLYLPSLNSAFHFDDEINITARNAIHIESLNLDSLTRAVTDALLPSRVLPNLSFAIDWWRGGGSPRPFQWTNILIHGANAALLFLLAVLIFRQRLSGTPRNRMVLGTAFMVALIWALHPIQIQAVSYIVQRMASMAAFFSLFTVLCYLRGRLNGGWYWYLFSLIGFGLGALSKENAWIAPALIWLAEFGVVRHQRPLLPSKIVKLLFALPFIVFLWVTLDLISGVGPWSQYLLGGYADRDFTLTERLLTQPRVIVFHFSQLLWPLPGRFSIEHDFVLSTGLLTPPQTLAALAAVFGWCALGLWALCQQSYRLQGFLLLWVPVTLAIESSVVPLEMVFEHRMYMPTLGLALLIGLGLLSLLQGSRRIQQVAVSTALIAILLLGVSTQIRLPVWQSTRQLYESALAHAPDSARTWNNYGSYSMREGRPEEAITAFNKAVELDPKYPGGYSNRGTFLSEQRGKHKEGIKDLNKAIELLPDFTQAHIQRARIYARMGSWQRAIDDYSQSIKQKKHLPLVYYERGLSLARIGNTRAAIEDMTVAIDQDGQYLEAYINRAGLRMLAGDLAGAQEDLKLADRLNPGNPSVAYVYGRVYLQAGNRARASEYFEYSCRKGDTRACDRLNRLGWR